MKLFAFVLAVCLLPLSGWAQEDYKLSMHFTKADVRDILLLYEKLSTHRVFASLDLNAVVTIVAEKEIPSAQAVELIRKTLLERYGIELRTSEHGETLAGWSKDAKYPRRSDTPMTREEIESLSKGGLRVINP